MYEINEIRSEVSSDQDILAFDPRDANNSVQWNCVDNAIFTQKTAKAQTNA
jgi:hypothetical protein